MHGQQNIKFLLYPTGHIAVMAHCKLITYQKSNSIPFILPYLSQLLKQKLARFN
jgi:hypothetical protein